MTGKSVRNPPAGRTPAGPPAPDGAESGGSGAGPGPGRLRGFRGRRPRRRSRLQRLHEAGPFTYAMLTAVVLASAFPLYWTAVVASHDNEAVARTPPPLVPGGNLLENIRRVFTTTDFTLALVNSFLVASAITVSVLVFCSLAGFAFAKLRFRGRQALLMTVIGTMMVPTQLGIIPLYILMGRLGWAGTLPAVIVPGMVTAFGVFWMRQFISEGVPDELIAAARMDGCHTLRVYWHVILPAIRPAAAVLGVFTFMQAWNDFFWPLVVLTPEDPTVQVALSTLSAGYFQDYSLILAGTALATLPVLLVFALLGRQIIGGIMAGAVKG
ncbi:carbohydrate ABC transporter permease [Streptomyces sp. NPDC004609]|uniref:carbohydrate ABC transporter permease n=1 Tax=Streptomyces sp. NPDC004609 TaxID=3364704 RepID=UPI0036BD5F33